MNKYAFTIKSREMFYWVGFLMADGNVYIKKRYRKHGPTEKPCWDTKYKLSLGLQSRDRKHLEKFCIFMGSDQNKKIRDEQNNRSVRIEFDSRELLETVMQYGIVPQKSLIAKPKNIPEEYVRSFVLGYYDGDGNFTKGNFQSPTIYIAGTETMLNYIARYIKDMIGFDSVVEPQQSIFRLRIHGALKVMAVMDHLYAGNETLSLERKYKQYRSFVDGFILRKRHLRTLYGTEA